MSAFRASALALAGCALLVACGGVRGHAPAEVEPLSAARAPRAPLPDDTERAAARLAAFALADRPDSAVGVLQEMRAEEKRRVAAGDATTGLVDDAQNLVHAMAGDAAYLQQSERMLERGDLDAVLRRRLERTLASLPERRAETRLSEERTFRLGTMFNRLAAPLARFAVSGALNPIGAARSLIGSLLTFRSFPDASARERQALRDYERYLRRDPQAPDADEVRQTVARLRERRDAHLRDRALQRAEQLLDVKRPLPALMLVERAERIHPEPDARTERAFRSAERLRREAEARVARSLHAAPAAQDAERAALLRALLVGPWREVSSRAAESPTTPGERRWLEAWAAFARGDEERGFEGLEETADGDEPSLARHAAARLADPSFHAHAYYRAAIRADRWRQAGWLAFGRHASGALERDLPRPLEYLLDVPAFAVSLLTVPVRLLQYPVARRQFGRHVLPAGERYLRRHPEGVHAAEVHRDLERRYARAGRYSLALEHLQAHDPADREAAHGYRERIAAQLLRAAEREERADMQAAIYRSVLTEHSDTPSAHEAGEKLRSLVKTATPQGIRLSRAFLLEHPALRGPGALGLRSELLDDDASNGELHEDGVTLIGRRLVRISLVDRDPVVRDVPAEDFARMVSLLEDASYRTLVSDPREKPQPDPQRDLFFERARLGLLEDADARPTARSTAQFLGMREKHGPVRMRESILPVDLVVRGDLETLGFSPVPRIRVPAPPPDAFLYE